MNAGQTKDRILISATEAFARNGFSGAHVAEIAEKANVNVARRTLMLSKWDINMRSLNRALEQLLRDSSLRNNMRRLKSLQDKVDGPAVAASEIVKFLGASNKKKEVVK